MGKMNEASRVVASDEHFIFALARFMEGQGYNVTDPATYGLTIHGVIGGGFHACNTCVNGKCNKDCQQVYVHFSGSCNRAGDWREAQPNLFASNELTGGQGFR